MKLSGWQIRNKHERSSPFILLNHVNDCGEKIDGYYSKSQDFI